MCTFASRHANGVRLSNNVPSVEARNCSCKLVYVAATCRHSRAGASISVALSGNPFPSFANLEIPRDPAETIRTIGRPSRLTRSIKSPRIRRAALACWPTFMRHGGKRTGIDNELVEKSSSERSSFLPVFSHRSFVARPYPSSITFRVFLSASRRASTIVRSARAVRIAERIRGERPDDDESDFTN